MAPHREHRPFPSLLSVTGARRAPPFPRKFRPRSQQVVQTFAIWQVVTYLFLHASISHVLWNMLALWLFGIEIERTWGTPKFLRLFRLRNCAAAFTVIVAAYIFGGTDSRHGRFIGCCLRSAGRLRRGFPRPDHSLRFPDSHEVQVLRDDHRSHSIPQRLYGNRGRATGFRRCRHRASGRNGGRLSLAARPEIALADSRTHRFRLQRLETPPRQEEV